MFFTRDEIDFSPETGRILSWIKIESMKLKKVISLALTLLLVSGSAAILHAQTPSNPREFEMKEGDTTYVMKQYILVMLLRGEKATTFSEAELKEIQVGHMANILRLSELGKLQVAGPMGDDTDLRGLFFMDCESVEEARALVETDPAIKAGRLKAEYHPWWTAKGNTFK